MPEGGETNENYFYPRPPGGGRLETAVANGGDKLEISIHALRVEGDDENSNFYIAWPISIHALRVEGDDNLCLSCLLQKISIHALRVEGDSNDVIQAAQTFTISIHALRVEGDINRGELWYSLLTISIHALRVEGDKKSKTKIGGKKIFLSTPSGWRATQYAPWPP